MSGLGNNQGGQSAKFLTTKEGKFYLSSDKNRETPFDSLAGILMKISYKDFTYEGAVIKQAEFTLSTTEGAYSFTVNLLTDSYKQLVSFLKNADLSKEITIVTLGEEAKGKIVTKFVVEQGGKYLKGFYSKAAGNELPKWKEVMVSGQKLWDKTEFLEALEADVAELNKALLKNSPEQVNTNTPSAEETKPASNIVKPAVNKVSVPPVDTSADESDDLPF